MKKVKRINYFIFPRTLFFVISFCGIGVNTFGSPIENNFKIEGNINLSSGNLILKWTNLLQEKVKNNTQFSSEIKGGKFTFEGSLKYPSCYFFQIQINDSSFVDSDMFILDENSQIAIIDTNFFRLPRIINKSMEEYNSSEYFKDKLKLIKDYKWLNNFKNSINYELSKTLKDSLLNVSKDIERNYQERSSIIELNINSEFKNSYFSLWHIYLKFNNSYDINTLLLFYKWLPTEISTSYYGKFIYQKLNDFDVTGVGKKFPELQFLNLKTEKSEQLHFEKKYTLIDFWWSGCSVCIKEFPFYLNIYNSSKNLEIIQISIDESKKLKFLQSIRERYNFPWIEFLDEGGEISKELKLYSYPSNFLISSNGEILEKNITRKLLQEYLKE